MAVNVVSRGQQVLVNVNVVDPPRLQHRCRHAHHLCINKKSVGELTNDRGDIGIDYEYATRL